MKTGISILVIFFFSLTMFSQKVGVVLSGGGATALAHVGFLKVLEEYDIPIDYITGSSMGAIIGGMYASGYSIEEIEAFVLSEEFNQMSQGEYDEDLNFYFKKQPEDASMITTKHFKGSFISTSLPTNLIDPVLMDYQLMRNLSLPSQAAGYNFDSLYVPFRCVASDIEEKESFIFDGGNLSVAVRASSAYPFYVPPVNYNGSLLYDGGLYNNFPSDIMYETFIPDVIIGNNVSDNIGPPVSGDLFSQLTNMIRHKTNFEPVCDPMIIIEPQTEVGTFDFDRIEEAINDGYNSAKSRIDEILENVERRQTKEEREKERNEFKSGFNDLIIGDIEIEGLDKSQKTYVRKVFGKNQVPQHIDKLEDRYYRVFSDDKIQSIFPELTYNNNTDDFTLTLDIEKEKDIFVSFGGNFSSRPINMGFVSLKYNFFGRTSSTISANSYFGKFYGSLHGDYRLDFSGKMPFSIRPHFTWNRWDYFRSFATFFEEVKPSFIVMNERHGGMDFIFPAGSKARINTSLVYGNNVDDYYQTDDFTQSDTSDRTVFNAMKYSVVYDRNTLNRKFFANRGTHLNIEFNFRQGEERTEPGSTSVLKDTIVAGREWFEARLNYTNYFTRIGDLQLGIHLSGVASTRRFFNNYRATLLHAPSFQPIPESKTFFIEQHRANNFATVGISGVLSINKNFDARFDGFMFAPFGEFQKNDLNQAFYDYDPAYYLIGSGSLMYHTPLGPISLNANYYDYKEEPWSFVFNFGYMIFNDSFRN